MYTNVNLSADPTVLVVRSRVHTLGQTRTHMHVHMLELLVLVARMCCPVILFLNVHILFFRRCSQLDG